MALQKEYLYDSNAPVADVQDIDNVDCSGAAVTYRKSPPYNALLVSAKAVVDTPGATGDWNLTVTEQTNSEEIVSFSDDVSDDAAGDELDGTLPSSPVIVPANSLIKFTEDAGNSTTNAVINVTFGWARIELGA